jgi:D-lactate dehydrogenase (cytochrome)
MVNKRVDLSPHQIEHLKSLVTGLVSTNETVLDQHGRDESAIPPVRPSVVVMPQSTEEVSKVLAYCNSEKIPVVAFGAGTSLEGHVLPLFGGISLDLTQMNKIIEIRADDLLVRVQPGVHRVALNEKLSSSGLFFSVDPGADATLGGMAATGAAGTTTVRYGSMRDNVLALTAVMADGTIFKTGRETRKLSAGYDLTRLLVGSEGTLAIITELTLRVFGIPEKMAAAIVRFPTLADGVTAATAIVRSGIAIARCEFLDAKCIKNVNAHDGLTLTEMPTLFFEFHGSPAGVAEDAASVKSIVEEFSGSEFEWTTDEGARRKLWQARHNAYWAGIAANPGKRAVSTDAAVPLSKLSDAVTVADQ